MRLWHFFWIWYHCYKANTAIAEMKFAEGSKTASWVNYWKARKDFHIGRCNMHSDELAHRIVYK